MQQMINELTEIDSTFKHMELKSHKFQINKVVDAIRDALARLHTPEDSLELIDDVLTGAGYVIVRNYCNRYKPAMSSIMTLCSLKHVVPEFSGIVATDEDLYKCTTMLRLKRMMNYKATGRQRRMLKPLFDGELEASKSNAIRRFVVSKTKAQLVLFANEYSLDRRTVLALMGTDEHLTNKEAFQVLFPKLTKREVIARLNNFAVGHLLQGSR